MSAPATHCEVVVVGGGPAGSTVAHRLARAGREVVLLDAERFPRVKPCAGWVTARVWRTLELDPAEYPLTVQPFRAASVEVEGEPGRRATRWAHAASWGIVRAEFDAYLLRRAAAAGARVLEGRRVTRVERVGERVRFETSDGDAWTTSLVVGAGGHGCPVARAFGEIHPAETVVVARESETPLPAERLPTAGESAPDLVFSADLSGYGWVFVKQRHLNVGLGTVATGATGGELNRRLAALLERLRAEHRMPPVEVPLEPFRGHAYALHEGAVRRAAGPGFLLVGDAAGLARALSGEGIGPAVESGALAADAILARPGDPHAVAAGYAAALRARFGSGRHPWRDHLLRALPASAPARLGRFALRNPWTRRHLLLEGAFGMGR